ncbi:hypothetical protein PPYR_07371 [Photinus pyralis]|uniref:RRM domain-containing protein n=1 Tax=Photinus pyralis TaxID=7054 RepID=A0A5N4AQA7_PHOPY|nr:RNA-binding protein 41-like [Photinus pyralis]KAB0799491.1 hypothetical protein PPYR_07371 [Photinus pyralis]
MQNEMSEVKNKNFCYEWCENEPPSKKLISDGDILIKKLVENQKKTDITLQQHLTHRKEFEKGADITPLSRYNPGTSNLSDILSSTKHFNDIERLKAAGLTDQDAQLYLDSLNGSDYLHHNHKNWEKSLLQKRLEQLKGLVQLHEAKASQSTEEKNLLQYGLTIKPNSIETKLLKFALGNTKQTPSHPITSVDIKDIEAQRFRHLNNSNLASISTIRKKSRKLQRRLDKTCNVPDVSTPDLPLNTKSKWDLKTAVESVPNIPFVQKKTYTCSPRSYYTIHNGEIVPLTNSGIPEQHLVATKLSLDEIKALPRFKDYSPGNPSKVLYLKNLGNSVKEGDLHSLFKGFADSVTEYKLMKGRLRGQAFVTFEDETSACRALEELNGSVLRNKPIIIQYSCGRG